MPAIISFVNQKGGTGKSTASVNVASKLALDGHRPLLIDVDPQANATVSLGVSMSGASGSMYDVLLGQVGLAEVLQENSRGVTVAPGNAELANADISLEGHQTRLKAAIADHVGKFEYVVIDCPPALNLLTINALVASSVVVIPILCDYLSMEGLKQLLGSIERIRTGFNKKLQILGILPNMVDRRRNLTEEVLGLVRKEFKDLVFRAEIPVCVALAEAPSFGKDIFSYASWSTGAEAYDRVVKELLKRLGSRE